MIEHKSYDMVLRYLTPDLVDMKQEELILEIIWLRYCLDFQEALQFKNRSKGGNSKGKKSGEELSSYDLVRIEIFRTILTRASEGLPVTKKHLDQFFHGREKEGFSENLIKEIYGVWRKRGSEILGLLANTST